ncbi:hypothetical protein [Streptomyces sp. NL15-2K]|uniref:hypothetical protein n=1 Tax=Streptomyces sp. NL15-2K TaxID=376149 RepID=UPI000F586CB7|nr:MULTISPECIES: hypothetical protein [Actinomycetes]WKX10920.1 hypothetical protein Q4V64_26805 [Kutzneria buriramensis]GCB47515.1 hypothetical protein SNL152K_4820 [Streptomyces sp. NL15-2K]
MRSALPALRGYVPPLLVHLLIGVPAALAVLCARWYIAYGHCEYDDLDRRDLDGCTYDQIENNGFALIALIWIGALVLLLLLLFDVLRPLHTGRPLKPRLLTLPAVLIPYAVYVTNGGW